MRKASLFSGIGGIDLAAKWAGMETVVFCERETFPQQVLRKHWPDVPIIDDVHDFTREELYRLDIGTIDIISAGYPCQPFSYAGKRRGAEDDRHLWPEVKRILSEIRPRWFVGENVAGHVTLGLDDVLSDLESLDYTAQAFVIPAAAVYASHRRDRVFIVAYSESEQNRRREQTGIQSDAGADGQNVAYANSIGNHSEGRHRANGNGQEENKERQQPQRGPCDNRETMADYASEGFQREQRQKFERTGNRPSDSNKNVADTSGARRATQSRMGRDADEFPAEMDGGGLNPLDTLKDFIDSYPQPALFGQPQYDWEPPRVESGVKNRAARLKALGNAVDPLQIYPIMYAIKLIDESTAYGNDCPGGKCEM